MRQFEEKRVAVSQVTLVLLTREMSSDVLTTIST